MIELKKGPSICFTALLCFLLNIEISELNVTSKTSRICFWRDRSSRSARCEVLYGKFPILFMTLSLVVCDMDESWRRWGCCCCFQPRKQKREKIRRTRNFCVQFFRKSQGMQVNVRLVWGLSIQIVLKCDSFYVDLQHQWTWASSTSASNLANNERYFFSSFSSRWVS